MTILGIGLRASVVITQTITNSNRGHRHAWYKLNAPDVRTTIHGDHGYDITIVSYY